MITVQYREETHGCRSDQDVGSGVLHPLGNQYGLREI